MSNVSARHLIQSFVAGKTSSLTGQRLAKVGYKTTKKTPAKYPSVCASVPFLSTEEIAEQASALIPYIRTMLETAQDGIIRSLYESSEGKLEAVHDSELSVSACIAFMEAEAAGDRLTKARIEAWFDESVQENLSVLIAEKLGVEDTEHDGVKKQVKVFRDVLSMLAGGKTLLNEKQIKGCRTAIALCPNDDDISVKLEARLKAMESPKITEEMLDI